MRLTQTSSPGTLVFWDQLSYPRSQDPNPNPNARSSHLEKLHVSMHPCHPSSLHRGISVLFLVTMHDWHEGMLLYWLQTRCHWCWARSASTNSLSSRILKLDVNEARRCWTIFSMTCERYRWHTDLIINGTLTSFCLLTSQCASISTCTTLKWLLAAARWSAVLPC